MVQFIRTELRQHNMSLSHRYNYGIRINKMCTTAMKREIFLLPQYTQPIYKLNWHSIIGCIPTKVLGEDTY